LPRLFYLDKLVNKLESTIPADLFAQGYEEFEISLLKANGDKAGELRSFD